MRTSPAGIALIKKYEGCRLTAYRDVVGVLTIGWGHTGVDVYAGMTITQRQADFMLEERLRIEFEPGVVKAIGVAPTTQPQFDAMVSLAYNIGVGAFAKSSVARCHVGAYRAAAASAFLLWNMAGGRVLAGLVRRRTEERALYLSAPLVTPQPETLVVSQEETDARAYVEDQDVGSVFVKSRSFVYLKAMLTVIDELRASQCKCP